MNVSRKTLCVVYALIALFAFVSTWSNILDYWHLGSGAALHFWVETLANPASRFITIDILFLSFVVIVWMVLEARRLAMRGVWLWIVFGILVAVSVAIPLFMIHRERTLAARDSSVTAGTLGAGDVAGIAVLGVVVLAYTGLALSR